jgi:hypothetical protein
LDSPDPLGVKVGTNAVQQQLHLGAVNGSLRFS